MRSLRAFIISFVLSLAVFGTLAYTIVENSFDYKFSVPTISDSTVDASQISGGTAKPEAPKNESSDPVGAGEETTDIKDIELPEGKENEAAFLFVRTNYQPSVFDYNKSSYDEDGNYIAKKTVKAESFLVVKINRDTKTFLFSAIPANTIMNKKTNQTIGELYAEKGAAYMSDCVYALTGLQIEHLFVIGAEDCVKVFEKIGKVSYTVPCDMVCDDKEENIKINLKAGMQNLSPEEAVALLRFNKYDSSSKYTQEKVTVDFAKTMFQKLTSPAYAEEADSLFKQISQYFETNFSAEDFKENKDLIFSYSKFTLNTVTFPGYEKSDGNKNVFVPSTSEALDAYQDFN